MHFVKKTVLGFLVALLCGAAWCGVVANGHAGARRVNHLRRDGSHGRIAVEVESNRFSESAKVSLSRTRADGVKRKIMEGLAKKRRGRGGARLLGAAKDPTVLAMYDISIESNGAKWQPAAGEPAQVTVDLAEPVTVAPGVTLGVAHLADDGTVEELPESRYGFRYNAAKTEIVSFWFSAEGFSVYAITDFGKTTSNPGRRLYDFYSLDFDVTSSTYNQYVKRYFTTIEGNKTFRQIVKSGEKLTRPEVLPSPLGRTFIGWHLYDPAKANQTVEGVTYDSEGYATEKFDFDQDIVFDELGEREFVLRAVFTHVGYVVFHEQKVGEVWPITAVRREIMTEREESAVEGGATVTVTNMYASVRIDDVKVTYDDTANENEEQANAAPRMIFRGWSATPVEAGSLVDTNGVAVVLLDSPYVFSRRKDTEAKPRHLYPVFVNINWLTFKAAKTGEGATYIPPKFYYEDEGENVFKRPTRTGYIFKGWYTSEVGGVQVVTAAGALNTSVDANKLAAWGGVIQQGKDKEGNEGTVLMLRQNATLYAQWDKGASHYMIVILKQSVEDDKDLPDDQKTYDFYKSYKIENGVKTEDIATVASTYKNLVNSTDSKIKKDLTGFYYRTCDPDTKVRGDGTTVLNVYYDRYKVMYVFHNANSPTASYLYAETDAPYYYYTPTTKEKATYKATEDGYYIYTEVSGFTYTDASPENYEQANGYVASYSSNQTYSYYATANNGEGSQDGTNNTKYYKLDGTRLYWNYDAFRTSDNWYAARYTGDVYIRRSGTVTIADTTTQYFGVNGSRYFPIYYVDSAWRQSNSSSGTVYTGNRYTLTIIDGIYYGTTDGGDTYFRIYYRNGAWRTGDADDGETYNGSCYTRTANTDDQHYGIVAGSSEYSPLYYRNGEWRLEDSDSGAVFEGTHYTRAVNEATQYGKVGKEYVQLYYVNGAWRTSDEANGTIYTGRRYTCTFFDETQYGTPDGESPYDCIPFQLYYRKGAWRTSDSDTGAEYKGTRYTRVAHELEQYGIDGDGNYFRVYYKNNAWRTSDSDTGEEYIGKRYTRISNPNNYRPMTGLDDSVMMGLYGQRLEDLGYSWPFEYAWKMGSSSTGITFLDAFNAGWTEYTGYKVLSDSHVITVPIHWSAALNTDYKIYHVMQDLNGNFDTNNVQNYVLTYASGQNVNFTVTDKFEGFTAANYSIGSFTANPTLSFPSSKTISKDARDLWIYHTRNKYKLYFHDSADESATLIGDEYKTVEMYYGAPLIGYKPQNDPAPTKSEMSEGYTFSGWYSDSECSTRFNFNTTMPRNDLRAYAGWNTEWFLIQIDPNGGQLASGQSLWFWEPYNGDPIEEYTTVTRSFVESLDGRWYYAKQDRAYHELGEEWDSSEDFIEDRSAYYTQNQEDLAIVHDGKRYENVKNKYRYAGWFQVNPDGSEELYKFGEPVFTNTTIRLHWKHLGTYNLVYDAGLGNVAHNDENEKNVLTNLDVAVYADSSEILVTRTAIPPPGYSFTGWRIRNGDGTTYIPGQHFVFNSAYTIVTGVDVAGEPQRTLVLDAQYHAVRTVSLTTDANGGTVDPDVAVTLPLAYPDAPSLITNITDTARTVSGMRNNAYGRLSDGTGYSCTVTGLDGNSTNLMFMGWNTKADGTGTTFAGGTYIGLDTVGTENEDGKNYLYAMWAVPIYFNKNNDNYEWHPEKWTEKWGDFFKFDEGRNEYYMITNLNGYATYPNIVAESHDKEDKMFVFWSTERYKENATRFDFVNTQITAPLVLYATWDDLIKVPFHAVDASDETIVDHSTLVADGGWLKQMSLRVGNDTVVNFENSPTEYVQVPEGQNYQYAFTCLSDTAENVSEAKKIKRVYFNYDPAVRAVWVEYDDAAEGADHGTLAPMPSNMEIFVVYFKSPKTIPIAYKEMSTKGVLSPADLRSDANAPMSATVGAADAPYDMTSDVARPNWYVNRDRGFYSFAIGDLNAESATGLRIITDAKNTDGDRPQLKVRNTWRGFEYSLDGGAIWNRYGYTAQLYVVYFESQPTIVTLKEKTVGTEDDVAKKFTYNVSIKEVVKTVTINETSTLTDGRRDSNSGGRSNGYPIGTHTYYFATALWSDGTIVENSRSTEYTNPEDVLDGSVLLSDGGLEAITLFDSGDGREKTQADDLTASNISNNGNVYSLFQTRTRTITARVQLLTITQIADAAFTTANTGGTNSESNLKFVYDSAGDDTEVTFVNTRKELPVEFHVAFSQNGSIDNVDNGYRTEAASGYTLNVPIQIGDNVTRFTPVTEELLAQRNKLYDATAATDGILSQSVGDRRFVGVWYGRSTRTEQKEGEQEQQTADGNKVELVGRVMSIGFVKPSHSEYYEICLKNDQDEIVPLGDFELFYLYAQMPKIFYVAEGANGALKLIDPIRLADAVTGEPKPVYMNNGEPSEQGTVLDVDEKNALVVAFGGTTGFRAPMNLDGAHAASLNEYVLAAGTEGAVSRSQMVGATQSSSETILLKIVGGIVKWSLNGSEWNDFAGTPAVYAIYKESGYDLTIVETSLASEADKAADVFTVTITSEYFADGVAYEISGYTENGQLLDKITPVDNTITLKDIKSGQRITIMALLFKENRPKAYRIVQTSKPDRYTLKSVTINGSSSASLEPVENGVATYLSQGDETVEFTNVKTYSVSFEDYDGTVLKEAVYYPYGTPAAEPQEGHGADYVYIVRPTTDPARPKDDSNIYLFNGWNPIVHDVIGDQVYTAKYKAVKIPQLLQRMDNTTKLTVTYAEQADLLSAMLGMGVDMLKNTYNEKETSDWLNQPCENGLMRWECLRTGTPEDRLLLGTATDGSETQMTVQFAYDPSTISNLGYRIQHVLRKYNETEQKWKDVSAVKAGAEPVFANPTFEITLLDENDASVNAAGFYRIFTQIIPKHREDIINEIPCTNIIGVLEVDSNIRNTMTAVPWKALPSDPKNPGEITVDSYVQKGQLQNGDSVYMMDADGKYERWTLEKSEGATGGAGLASATGLQQGNWVPNGTVKSDDATGATAGASLLSVAPAADCRCIERGTATWVERDGRRIPYFLVGQYFNGDIRVPIQEGTSGAPASTMVTNPNLTAIGVNEIDWGANPAADDRIHIPTDTDKPLTLRWKNGSWGQSVVDRAKMKNIWKNDYTIPAGTGIWYVRRGGAFTITVPIKYPDFGE